MKRHSTDEKASALTAKNRTDLNAQAVSRMTYDQFFEALLKIFLEILMIRRLVIDIEAGLISRCYLVVNLNFTGWPVENNQKTAAM